MEYFNNICLDCRNRIGPKSKSDKSQCKVYFEDDPLRRLRPDIALYIMIDIATSYEAYRLCTSFDDRHELSRELYCDYKKYPDEMRVMHRLTSILNHDLGVNEFEGAMIDFLRNNTNKRIDKECVDD